MRSMYQVLSKQIRLQVASQDGTVEIRVSQFIRQWITNCWRSHGKGTTAIRVQLDCWNDLQCVADLDSRRRLRSSSTSTLAVPSTRLSTVSDRAFPVAAARVWNTLPAEVTSSPSLPTFKRRLKTVLFARSYPYSFGRVWLLFTVTLRCSHVLSVFFPFPFCKVSQQSLRHLNQFVILYMTYIAHIGRLTEQHGMHCHKYANDT